MLAASTLFAQETPAPSESGGFIGNAPAGDTPPTALPARIPGPLSVSAGLEVNNNHRKGVAGGFTVTAEYRLLPFLALGARGGINSNFGYANIADGLGFVRLILPLRRFDLFVQGGAGQSWIYIYEGNLTSLLYEGGAGLRLPLNGLYIEALARAGYPFLWGASVSVGHNFTKKARKERRTPLNR
jgi:hypothetical protein